MKEYTNAGMAYTWELASSEGAAFMLFPNADHSKEDIQKAKAWLRDNHDVVSLKVADENDLDEDYRSAIFREPLTKPLKWYQINAEDRKLLRAERKKGTTPLEYVEKYVLPSVKVTELRNRAVYGDKLL